MIQPASIPTENFKPNDFTIFNYTYKMGAYMEQGEDVWKLK